MLLSCKNFQKRRFAGAVAADEADAFAFMEEQILIVNQHVAGDLDMQLCRCQNDLRHRIWVCLNGTDETCGTDGTCGTTGMEGIYLSHMSQMSQLSQ